MDSAEGEAAEDGATRSGPLCIATGTGDSSATVGPQSNRSRFEGVKRPEVTAGRHGEAPHLKFLPEERYVAWEERAGRWRNRKGKMGKRILLIDGDQTISEAIDAALGSAGHRIRTETSGADALEVFSRNPHAFDLIVMDMGLPDISGLLLAERLLKLRADIPIVLLAGAEGQAQARARDSGIRWFGIKPVSMTDLTETVEKALAGVE